MATKREAQKQVQRLFGLYAFVESERYGDQVQVTAYRTKGDKKRGLVLAQADGPSWWAWSRLCTLLAERKYEGFC